MNLANLYFPPIKESTNISTIFFHDPQADFSLPLNENKAISEISKSKPPGKTVIKNYVRRKMLN
jgi:hypothetical protein